MTDGKNFTLLTRVTACLWGGAVGDAMGKATEGYTPDAALKAYGRPVERFVKPIQTLSEFTWEKAEVTEDTRQTVALAKAVLAKGKVDQLAIAGRLLECGPKGIGVSSRLFHFILTGDLGHVSLKGSGTGAATRIAPVGIVNTTENMTKLVSDVVKATAMTHGGKTAVAGAAAMAAAVAAAIEGKPAGQILLVALQAAKYAEQYGYPDGLESVARKLEKGIKFAYYLRGEALFTQIKEDLGWGFAANEAVPAALLVACSLLNAKQAIITAVNQGGDADAVAGMAGALAAAINPPSLPRNWVEEVCTVNNLELAEIARGLVRLRPNAAIEQADAR
ncbi:MAG TPA: ADP-ribosylglycohydrolase family protein [Desulfobacteria bacterium]|nr:ADP-ribosylglycohydrolase family protein [Desulfobacteria bacterium]